MDVAAAIEDEQRAKDEVDTLTVLADDLDLTAELLKVAKDKAHANIAPLLNQTLRPWIPRVTDDRYDDVRIDSTTLELEVRLPAVCVSMRCEHTGPVRTGNESKRAPRGNRAAWCSPCRTAPPSTPAT